MVLISCPHTNAERMSLSDGAASLLAAGVHAADEGAGCLKRREVLSEGVKMRDSTKLGGLSMTSTGQPEHERVVLVTRSGPRGVTRNEKRGPRGAGLEKVMNQLRKPLENAVGISGGA